MIFQRLDALGTLSVAVRELVCGPVRKWVRWRSGRARGDLSASTSAYSQARSRLPLEVAEKVSDLIFESLLVEPTVLPGLQQPLFLLDGSTLSLPHSEDLVRSYPPARNQHGASHWSVMRVLVAHEVVSGLAVRPCWGPLDGPQAVSEQGLAKQMLARLPAGSVVLGDRNFGVFSMAYHAQQQQHPCLFRLTAARAQKLHGGALPNAGTDRKIQWVCSRDDRRSNPELSSQATVEGRLLAVKVLGTDGKPHAGRACRGHHRVALGDVSGHGLLDNDVLPCVRGGDDVFGVGIGLGGDHDEVDVVALQQVGGAPFQ